MTKPAIQAGNLSVRYGSFSALESVDLRIGTGEFVSIVGTSGSGKTTLLNALAGFVQSTGSVNVPDKIGVVFQDYSVFPWMTVSKNIAFGLNELEHKNQEATIQHYLELIQMEDKASKYPGELSGGQVQRVAIARAFAPEPYLILMDEPFGSLDRHTRERMQHWLLKVWNERHKTIVFVTHDIEEAVFLSDRVIVLRDRRIDSDFMVTFERPRSEQLKVSEEFLRLKQQVLLQMSGSLQAAEV